MLKSVVSVFKAYGYCARGSSCLAVLGRMWWCEPSALRGSGGLATENSGFGAAAEGRAVR